MGLDFHKFRVISPTVSPGTPLNPFPPQEEVNPGDTWSWEDGVWGVYPDIDARGGGRYKNNLMYVAVDGDGKGIILYNGARLDNYNGYTWGELKVDGYFAAVPAYQTVWFCDGRPYSATIGSSGYHKLDTTSTSLVGAMTLGTFTTGEAVTQDTSGATGVFIETVGSGATAKNLVYRTSTVEFDTTNLVHNTGSTATMTPTAVKMPPHWLNWTLTTGDFPDGGSNIMCLFEGRLWMNSMYNPNQWFATRAGDPLDIDTSQEDLTAAISSQTSEAGLVADAVVSLIPYKDNYLLFGMANSFGILRGGSFGGGNISNLTTETGIFSPESYCWDNNGNLYVVGLNGFFKFPNNMAVNGIAIDNISQRHIPNFFREINLNRKNHRVVLGFNRYKNEVHVSIFAIDGSWSAEFLYDVETDSIFPMIVSSNNTNTAFAFVNKDENNNGGLLVGNNVGQIVEYSPDVFDDCGIPLAARTAIHSFVLLGPINLNEVIRANVKIQEIQILLSENSDGITWKLYQEKSNEALVDGVKSGLLQPTYSGTFTDGGRQYSIRDKISGESIGILLESNSLDTSWGFESIKIKMDVLGKVKE